MPIKGTGYTLAKYTGTEHSPTTHKGLRDRLERHLCNRLGRHVHTRAVKSSVGVGQTANNCYCSCCAQRPSTMPKAAWLRAADGMYRSTSLPALLDSASAHSEAPSAKGPCPPKALPWRRLLPPLGSLAGSQAWTAELWPARVPGALDHAQHALGNAFVLSASLGVHQTQTLMVHWLVMVCQTRSPAPLLPTPETPPPQTPPLLSWTLPQTPPPPPPQPPPPPPLPPRFPPPPPPPPPLPPAADAPLWVPPDRTCCRASSTSVRAPCAHCGPAGSGKECSWCRRCCMPGPWVARSRRGAGSWGRVSGTSATGAGRGTPVEWNGGRERQQGMEVSGKAEQKAAGHEGCRAAGAGYEGHVLQRQATEQLLHEGKAVVSQGRT